MPWKAKAVMFLREEFIVRAERGDASVAALCREYGISRKTAYKWLTRFEKGGFRALADMVKKPRSSPLQVAADVAVEVVAIRRQHPTWGAKKIREMMRRQGDKEVPSLRTTARILERAGMVEVRRKRPRWSGPAAAPRTAAKEANDLWTVDFKGWWRTGDKKRCEPLTVQDRATRFILCVQILSSTSFELVRKEFVRLFTLHGLPKAIQTDNGPPFASARNALGLTELSVWWMRLGIEVIRSRKAKPQDNGAHERMHLDMKRELEAFAALDARKQQSACDRWRCEFNELRPHEALAMSRPADKYRNSRRRYPKRLEPVTYGAHFVRRIVDKNGSIKLLGTKIFISEALRGTAIGLEPKDVNTYRIHLGKLVLGVLSDAEVVWRNELASDAT